MKITTEALLARNPIEYMRDLNSEMTNTLLSGAATFAALKDAVDEVCRLAPKDHDVLIQAFGILVKDIRFTEPHTLLFSGVDQSGNGTVVVAHYSQVVAHVVYLPKQGPERVLIGFHTAKSL